MFVLTPPNCTHRMMRCHCLQLRRMTHQLRESKDQNELLEFRIFELEKVNEELMELSSCTSEARKANNEVSCCRLAAE